MIVRNGTYFGIAIPQMFHPGSEVDMELIGEHLRLVESLGYQSAWVQDQTIGTMQTLDPLVLLAHAAACTRVMKLGVSDGRRVDGCRWKLHGGVQREHSQVTRVFSCVRARPSALCHE